MNAQEQRLPYRHRFFDSDQEDFPPTSTEWADPKLAAEMQKELEAEQDPPYGPGERFLLLVIGMVSLALVAASGVGQEVLQQLANLAAYIN